MLFLQFRKGQNSTKDHRNLHVEVSELGKAGLKIISLVLFMKATALM